MVVDHFFNISHYLQISPLRNSCHLIDRRLDLGLEDGGWLRMQHKRHCKKALIMKVRNWHWEFLLTFPYFGPFYLATS